MPENPRAIVNFLNGIEILISEANQSGLKYSEMLTLLLEKGMQLACRADMEYWKEKGS